MSQPYPYLRHASRTDVGLKREHNEDSLTVLPEQGVYVVADGMGGSEAGEVASQLTVSSVREVLLPYQDQPGINNLAVKARSLSLAVNQACRAIRAYVTQRGFSRSGSTFATLVLDSSQPGQAMALHAGDSRVYRWRKGKLDRVTRDHSVAGEVGITNEDKIPAMFVGVITRAVGITESVELEETPVDVKPGDLFIICSDGLSNMVPDAAMTRLIKARKDESLDEFAELLIREANAAGGKDNISVVLVEMLDHPAFQQPVGELALPPGFDAEDSGDPATATTGNTGASDGSTNASSSFSLRHELAQDKTSLTAPTHAPAAAAPVAAPAGKVTFEDLTRMAGPSAPPPAARPVIPRKAWIAIAVLVAILLLLLMLPSGRKPTAMDSAPAPVKPAPVEKPSTADAPPTPAPEPGPATPAPETPAPVTTAPEPVTPPVAPAVKPEGKPDVKPAPEPAPETPAPSGLADALAAMAELKKPEAPAPATDQPDVVHEAVMPKPPVELPPATPAPPPPPPKPTPAEVAAAARTALVTGNWGAFTALEEQAGPDARSALSPAEATATQAWLAVWRSAGAQTELTAWFDPIFNLEDEWREFQPAFKAEPLAVPAAFTADTYCQALRHFSSNLPARASAARPAWDGMMKAFGKTAVASLGNIRKLHGRALPADSVTALETQFPSLQAGSDLLRLASELPADLPVPRDILTALTELKLRERTLLVVNTVGALGRHSAQKGDVVIQQQKNILIGHGQQQSPGMVLLDELSDRNAAFARAAKGGNISPEWFQTGGETLSRLLESTDRFVKWQAEQVKP